MPAQRLPPTASAGEHPQARPPMSCDQSADASLWHRALHLLKLLATTLAALVGVAQALGWL